MLPVGKEWWKCCSWNYGRQLYMYTHHVAARLPPFTSNFIHLSAELNCIGTCWTSNIPNLITSMRQFPRRNHVGKIRCISVDPNSRRRHMIDFNDVLLIEVFLAMTLSWGLPSVDSLLISRYVQSYQWCHLYLSMWEQPVTLMRTLLLGMAFDWRRNNQSSTGTFPLRGF